ncbi:MAG: DUF4861 family protein, partial [Armatimonadetes bacterium]|nr:DUF4861 family protein [Armatimonadota bacterium]
MTCVVIADLDDDNKMWRLVNYEYNQDVCQWQCDFTGNEWFSMGHYDERQRRWISWLENPFCFYDLDGDGDPEVAVRYSGNDLAVRSLRYSFDVDNDATPDSPKDYDFSVTALGSVQCPEELATTFPLRGGGKLTYVSWEHARELAEWAPWSRAELCWDENDNNVNPNGPERVHERWEGVIAHGAKLFPQEGGPSCGPFNKRYEADNDFSGRMGLYLSGIDHRFHLRGAELGWLDADYDNNGRVDMRFRYEDTDGNGFFDTWHVDTDADGKEEWSARFSEEQVRLVSWDYREMRQTYTQVLARATSNQARRLSALKRPKDPMDAKVERYWKEGLPGFYAAEKVRGSREGARYYTDLMLAELATKSEVPVFLPDRKEKIPPVIVGLKLTNTLPTERKDEPVVLSLSKLPEVRAALRRDRPFVALRDGDRLAAAQADDLNGDGVFDEVVFQTSLAARETRTVTLIANPPRPLVDEKRTAANLYMGASLGWESNLIAYRSYYGKIDLFGKKESLLKLRDLKGAYHREADWGMDILHLGPSAGVGGLYLWSGGNPVPAMNEEGQRENVKISKRVVVDGGLRSIVEVKLEGLRTPQGVFNLTRRFSIYADELYTEEQLTITGGNGGDILYSPGLLRIEGERFERGKVGALSYVCNWGKQSHPDVSEAGELGLALIARPDKVVEVAATEHDHVLRCRARSGKSQRQYLVADWAKGKRYANAEEWRAFIANLSQRLAAPVKWSRETGA